MPELLLGHQPRRPVLAAGWEARPPGRGLVAGPGALDPTDPKRREEAVKRTGAPEPEPMPVIAKARCEEACPRALDPRDPCALSRP